MASWNNQTQQPSSGGRPTANPMGGSLTKDDIQLKRLTPKASDPSSLLKSAFEYIKEHPLEVAVLPIGILIVLSLAQQLIGFIINIAMSAIGQGLAEMMGGGDAAFYAVTAVSFMSSMTVSIIFSVIMAAFMGGVNIMWLRIIRGQSVSISDISAITPFLLPLILTSFLVQIPVMLGFFFLVVPGIIIALGLMMVQFIIIDKNLRYLDAMKASWELMNGHKLELFIFVIILFFLNMAGVMAFCVGMLVTYAISVGGMVAFYDAIAEPGNAYGNNLGSTPDVFS